MNRQPDAHMHQTYDSHGAPIWVRIQPPTRWDYRRRGLRGALLCAAGAIALALILVATVILIALATEPAPAAGATDRPGRPAYVCRYRLVHVSPDGMMYRQACRRQS